jgi:hypothetical protein
MKNVQKIIDLKGGIAALKTRYIRLESPPFMRLVIEHVGTGPRGGDLIAVAHYTEQNGDSLRDHELVFEVKEGVWQPVSVQMDFTGYYREAVAVTEDGRVLVRHALVRDLQSFARTWDHNIREQGFMDAAQAGR